MSRCENVEAWLYDAKAWTVPGTDMPIRLWLTASLALDGLALLIYWLIR